MTERARKYLADIEKAIDLIEIFLQEIEGFDDYMGDLKTQSAVERQLGIIGEAVGKLRSEVAISDLKNTQEIIGFRNRLIHNYDGVDETIVWAIIVNHLPTLRKEVLILLNS